MRVNIKSDGGSTVVTDQDGKDIHGITKIVIEPDAPPTAALWIDAFTADMAGRMVMIDPRDGEVRTIRRVEFDGAAPFEPGVSERATSLLPSVLVLRPGRPLTEQEAENFRRQWDEMHNGRGPMPMLTRLSKWWAGK